MEERIIYLGFTNTLIGILFLLTPLGGLLADLVSFEALFGVAGVAALIATILAVAAHRRFARSRTELSDTAVAVEADGA